MSDELTALPEAGVPSWRAPLLQGLATLVLALVLGAVAGLLWHQLWKPSSGLVWDHQWQKGLLWIDAKTGGQGWSENAHQDVFAATGWYVVLTGIAGLVVGAVSALWLSRSELSALVASVVGGVAGAGLAAKIGFALRHADPNRLAKTLPNKTLLPDQMHWSGPWLLLVFPGAALLALAVGFLALERRAEPVGAAGVASWGTSGSEPPPSPVVRG